MRCRLIVLLTTAACFASSPALAGYGLSAMSTGGESHAMGSADTAASHNGIGSNSNPAGLTGIKNGNLSGYLEGFYYSDWAHSDSLGNDDNTQPSVMLVGGGGWAQRLESNPNIVLGMAITAQGGVGFEYPDLLTEAGNRDRLSASFGVFRFAPALGWQVNDRLSLGVSVGLNYSEAEQKVFPDTAIAASGADPGFAGIDIQGVSGWSLSYRLGVQYALTPSLDVGAAYGSATELQLRSGRARVNYAGLGKVRYNDAEIDGLELAEDVQLGMRWKFADRWQLLADIGWYNHTESLNDSVVTLRRADNPAAPQDLVIRSPINFQNQLAFGGGLRYDWNDKTVLMAGFAYTPNPIPPENTTPLLSLIVEQHFTVGIARKLTEQWRVVATYYYMPQRDVSYANSGLPLGAESKATAEGHDFTVTLERNW